MKATTCELPTCAHGGTDLLQTCVVRKSSSKRLQRSQTCLYLLLYHSSSSTLIGQATSNDVNTHVALKAENKFFMFKESQSLLKDIYSTFDPVRPRCITTRARTYHSCHSVQDCVGNFCGKPRTQDICLITEFTCISVFYCMHT